MTENDVYRRTLPAADVEVWTDIAQQTAVVSTWIQQQARLNGWTVGKYAAPIIRKHGDVYVISISATPPRPPLDPDPRYVPEDPRVPEPWEHRRQKVVQRSYANDLTESTSCLLLVVGLLVIVLVVVAILVAPRSGPDPTTPPPASDAAGSVRALALVTASTSDPSQSMALPPTRLVSGSATWYCGPSSACTKGYRPSDLVAAIDTSTGFGKGDLLRVRAFGKHVDVLVVDVCECIGNRVIDLTRGAFARLANPDYGVIHVTLELVGGIGEPVAVTAPPTDVEP